MAVALDGKASMRFTSVMSTPKPTIIFPPSVRNRHDDGIIPSPRESPTAYGWQMDRSPAKAPIHPKPQCRVYNRRHATTPTPCMSRSVNGQNRTQCVREWNAGAARPDGASNENSVHQSARPGSKREARRRRSCRAMSGVDRLRRSRGLQIVESRRIRCEARLAGARVQHAARAAKACRPASVS